MLKNKLCLVLLVLLLVTFLGCIGINSEETVSYSSGCIIQLSEETVWLQLGNTDEERSYSVNSVKTFEVLKRAVSEDKKVVLGWMGWKNIVDVEVLDTSCRNPN